MFFLLKVYKKTGSQDPASWSAWNHRGSQGRQRPWQTGVCDEICLQVHILSLPRLSQWHEPPTSSLLCWTCWSLSATRKSWRTSWKGSGSEWTRLHPTSSSRRRTRVESTCKPWCLSQSWILNWSRKFCRNTGKQHLEPRSISTCTRRISNADITLRCDATVDDLIDVVEGNRCLSKHLSISYLGSLSMVLSSTEIITDFRNYIPCIYLLNKIDQISIEELEIITKVWIKPKCLLMPLFWHFWRPDPPLCPYLRTSQVELRQSAWEDVGVSQAGKNLCLVGEKYLLKI